MPIASELSNLIVPKQVLESKYQGGISQFKKDFNFESSKHNAEDHEVIRIGAMNSDEFDLDLLITRGLEYNSNTNSTEDFVIVSRYGGALWKTEWLHENGVFLWHFYADPRSHREAKDRGLCPMNEIEKRYGSYENFYSPIMHDEIEDTLSYEELKRIAIEVVDIMSDDDNKKSSKNIT